MRYLLITVGNHPVKPDESGSWSRVRHQSVLIQEHRLRRKLSLAAPAVFDVTGRERPASQRSVDWMDDYPVDQMVMDV
jgi:hypothetical protein